MILTFLLNIKLKLTFESLNIFLVLSVPTD